MLGKRKRTKPNYINATSFESSYHDSKLKGCVELKQHWYYTGSRGYNGSFDRVDWKQYANTCLITTAECLLSKKVGDMNIIYLDGKDTCSTKCFKSLGVSPKNMFAVSDEPGVEENVSKVDNRVGFSSDNFLNVAKTHKYSYDVVYIDLCCTWKNGRDIVNASFDIADNNSIFAFSVCRRVRGGIEEKNVINDMKALNDKYPLKFKMRHVKTIKTASNYFVFIYHFH